MIHNKSRRGKKWAYILFNTCEGQSKRLLNRCINTTNRKLELNIIIKCHLCMEVGLFRAPNTLLMVHSYRLLPVHVWMLTTNLSHCLPLAQFPSSTSVNNQMFFKLSKYHYHLTLTSCSVLLKSQLLLYFYICILLLP